MRPTSLSEVVGQHHVLAPLEAFRDEEGRIELPSTVFWGPPGTGKTTIARLLTQEAGLAFIGMSAVNAGVNEVREAVRTADETWALERRGTALFLDEIHRFNRAQQDALLPFIEDNTVTLIGATTENPSFELITALLSRVQVLVLEPLSEDDLLTVLRRAVVDPRGLAGKVQVDDEVLLAFARTAGGDARKALNALERAARGRRKHVRIADVADAVGHKSLLYDKSGDQHFSVTSALIKSLRGSDADAAIYWAIRMIDSGEDPLYVLRRMVIFASEDVGNADPNALAVAVDALHAFELVGLPEGVYAIVQAAAYLALAPKSNSTYVALSAARELLERHGALAVPKHLRMAVTPLMRSLGYGRGYRYPHPYEGRVVKQRYLPDEIQGARVYVPLPSGLERKLARRLAELRRRLHEDEQTTLPLGDDEGRNLPS